MGRDTPIGQHANTNSLQNQPGIERFILLSKVCAEEKTTNLPVFDYVLEQLETEQKVLQMQDGSLIRYVYFSLGDQ